MVVLDIPAFVFDFGKLNSLGDALLVERGWNLYCVGLGDGIGWVRICRVRDCAGVGACGFASKEDRKTNDKNRCFIEMNFHIFDNGCNFGFFYQLLFIGYFYNESCVSNSLIAAA